MPKAYTEKERTAIAAELRCAAMESMRNKGVKKTTVDDLVAKVRIPKGTFYLFYPSKEMLLYDALMEKEEKIHCQLSAKLAEIKPTVTVESLTQLLYDFFQIGFNMGILPLMVSGELDILMRKLPDEVAAEHIAKDDEFLAVFGELFPAMCPERVADYSAAFRAVFFTA
ncbi:MAG: TetR/AcrR family transcriptional regulator, partial [Oscillospiraceae bacterium]